MSGLRLLVDEVEKAGVFKRNKTPLETKVLAAMLCFAGYLIGMLLRLLEAYLMGWCIGPSQPLIR